MKQKISTKILSMLFLGCLLAIPTVAADPISSSLIAGGGNGVGVTIGTVDVSNDAVNLIVTFTITADDWYLNETHLAVADDLAGIPQTRTGNPKPGHFDLAMEHDPGVKTFQYIISLSEITSVDGELCIAAHAEVTNMDEVVYVDPDTGDIYYREETAWGDGVSFTGSNWAMYFEYTVQ